MRDDKGCRALPKLRVLLIEAFDPANQNRRIDDLEACLNAVDRLDMAMRGRR